MSPSRWNIYEINYRHFVHIVFIPRASSLPSAAFLVHTTALFINMLRRYFFTHTNSHIIPVAYLYIISLYLYRSQTDWFFHIHNFFLIILSVIRLYSFVKNKIKRKITIRRYAFVFIFSPPLPSSPYITYHVNNMRAQYSHSLHTAATTGALNHSSNAANSFNYLIQFFFLPVLFALKFCPLIHCAALYEWHIST